MLCLPSIRLASELIVHETCLMNSLYLRTERKTCRGSVYFILLHFIERYILFFYMHASHYLTKRGGEGREGGGDYVFGIIIAVFAHDDTFSGFP